MSNGFYKVEVLTTSNDWNESASVYRHQWLRLLLPKSHTHIHYRTELVVDAEGTGILVLVVERLYLSDFPFLVIRSCRNGSAQLPSDEGIQAIVLYP